MSDCHVVTFMERAFRAGLGTCYYRGSAVHTASGRVLYVTWPYASQASAAARAARWIQAEHERASRAEKLELFE